MEYGGIAYRIIFDNCVGGCDLYSPNWNNLLQASAGTKFIGGSGLRSYSSASDLIADFTAHPVPISIQTSSIVYFINNYFFANIPNYSSIRASLLLAIEKYFEVELAN